MSEFVKPIRRTVSVRDAFAHLLDQELVKDLHDNEDICPVCKGTGVRIEPNRYGLSDDPQKHPMFPYEHQSLSFCHNCYNGIVRYCPDCGKQLQRGYLRCDCEAEQKRKREAERQKEIEALERAKKHEPSALGTTFQFCYGSLDNDGFFSEWEEFFEAWDEHSEEGQERPVYVFGTYEINMGFDAADIVSSACEELYEDAYDDISADSIKEMQSFLDQWVKTNGRTAYAEDRKHAVRIPWENYDKSEAGCLTPPTKTEMPVRR